MDKEEARKQYRKFFFYQVPFLAIGIVLIVLSYFVGIRKNTALIIFIIGASLLVLAPFMSLYAILISLKK